MGPKHILTCLLLLTVLASASSLRSNSQQALMKSDSLEFWPSVASQSNLQADLADRHTRKDNSKEPSNEMLVVLVVTGIIFAMCCGLIQALGSIWSTLAAKLTHVKSCEEPKEEMKEEPCEKLMERFAI
jgi:hypothetical protein